MKPGQRDDPGLPRRDDDPDRWDAGVASGVRAEAQAQASARHVTSICPGCGAQITMEPYDIGSGPELACPHCEMCWGANGQPLKPFRYGDVQRYDELTAAIIAATSWRCPHGYEPGEHHWFTCIGMSLSRDTEGEGA